MAVRQKDCLRAVISFWGGGVMVHWKNGWPVSVAINYNKVIMVSVNT